MVFYNTIGVQVDKPVVHILEIHNEEREKVMPQKELTLLPSVIQQRDGTIIPLDSLTSEERKEFATQMNIRAFSAVGIKARIAEEIRELK